MYEEELKKNLAILEENPLDWVARANVELLHTEQLLNAKADYERAEERRLIEQKWSK